jgi:hypothetical protein
MTEQMIKVCFTIKDIRNTVRIVLLKCFTNVLIILSFVTLYIIYHLLLHLKTLCVYICIPQYEFLRTWLYFTIYYTLYYDASFHCRLINLPSSSLINYAVYTLIIPAVCVNCNVTLCSSLKYMHWFSSIVFLLS